MEVERGDRISGGELRRQKCEVIRRGDFVDKTKGRREEGGKSRKQHQRKRAITVR